VLRSSDQPPPISVSPPPPLPLAPTPAIAAGEVIVGCAPAPRSSWGFGERRGEEGAVGKMVWARSLGSL
jgi:hypothetical protein